MKLLIFLFIGAYAEKSFVWHKDYIKKEYDINLELLRFQCLVMKIFSCLEIRVIN